MNNEQLQLDGVIEMHVHGFPDIRERKMDAWELIDAAVQANMRGLVLKNHFYQTMSDAKILQLKTSGLNIFGGLVLNESNGGLNPQAVEKALLLDAKIIWFPTHDAFNERTFHGKIGGIMILSEKDRPVQKVVYEILELIKESNAVLATGHLSFDEIVRLIQAANEVGVQNKLINHPGIIFQKFSLEQQSELVHMGAMLEHSYARPPHTPGWDDLAAAINNVGPDNVILATDLGQPQNTDPVSGMREIWTELLKRNFSKDELKTMTCTNPAMMLGI
ncbi:MAG: hypothetical protein HQK83_12110 [Fibrobacteria bacterium]|nr:hypothetical protein [Fibrobacteria bacterium]